jgi:hypothetical protein
VPEMFDGATSGSGLEGQEERNMLERIRSNGSSSRPPFALARPEVVGIPLRCSF